ncbi:hypothetical protein D9M68_817690 [compost metagenome]
MSHEQEVLRDITDQDLDRVGRALARQVGEVHGILQLLNSCRVNSLPDVVRGVVIADLLLVSAHPGARVLLFGVAPFPGNVEHMREQGDLAVPTRLGCPGIPILRHNLGRDGIDRGVLECLS